LVPQRVQACYRPVTEDACRSWARCPTSLEPTSLRAIAAGAS
jgi:hypothetical protein